MSRSSCNGYFHRRFEVKVTRNIKHPAISRAATGQPSFDGCRSAIRRWLVVHRGSQQAVGWLLADRPLMAASVCQGHWSSIGRLPASRSLTATGLLSICGRCQPSAVGCQWTVHSSHGRQSADCRLPLDSHLSMATSWPSIGISGCWPAVHRRLPVDRPSWTADEPAVCWRTASVSDPRPAVHWWTSPTVCPLWVMVLCTSNSYYTDDDSNLNELCLDWWRPDLHYLPVRHIHINVIFIRKLFFIFQTTFEYKRSKKIIVKVFIVHFACR